MESKNEENLSKCIDLVVTDAVELCLRCRGSMSPEELNEMVLEAAARLAPPATTAAQLLRQSPDGASDGTERPLSLLRQHKSLTRIAPRLLTEICGAAGKHEHNPFSPY